MLPFAASAGLTLLLEDDKVAAGADPRPPAPGRRGPRHSTWLPPPGLGCVFAGGVVRTNASSAAPSQPLPQHFRVGTVRSGRELRHVCRGHGAQPIAVARGRPSHGALRLAQRQQQSRLGGDFPRRPAAEPGCGKSYGRNGAGGIGGGDGTGAARAVGSVRACIRADVWLRAELGRAERRGGDGGGRAGAERCERRVLAAARHGHQWRGALPASPATTRQANGLARAYGIRRWRTTRSARRRSRCSRG